MGQARKRHAARPSRSSGRGATHGPPLEPGRGAGVGEAADRPSRGAPGRRGGALALVSRRPPRLPPQCAPGSDHGPDGMALTSPMSSSARIAPGRLTAYGDAVRSSTTAPGFKPAIRSVGAPAHAAANRPNLASRACWARAGGTCCGTLVLIVDGLPFRRRLHHVVSRVSAATAPPLSFKGVVVHPGLGRLKPT